MASTFVPAYIQGMQMVQNPNQNQNQNLANITNVLAAQKMDLPTAIGYALGKYALNRYNAWQDNKARDSELHPESGDTDNRYLKLSDGNVLDRNLMYQNQGNWADNAWSQAMGTPLNNPAIQSGTSAGTTAIDSTMANAAQQADAAPQLLGNLGGSQTVSQAQGNSSQSAANKTNTAMKTLGLLGAANSLQNIANGTGNAGDVLNVAGHFFADAAPQTMSTAANVFRAADAQGLPNIGGDLINQQEMAAQLPKPALDADGRQLASQLVAYKNAWEVADKAHDDKGKAEASQGAGRIRSLAQQLGIDLSPYDADKTLGDAQTALALDGYRGVRHILNEDQNSEDYYNDVYDRLKARGFGEDTSRRIAAELAGRYQAGRLTRLENAFTEYGVDPANNIMNNYGTAILMQMMREDPNAASGLAKMYGMPSTLTDIYQTTTKQNNQARNTIAANSQNNAERYQYGILTDNNRAKNESALIDQKGKIQRALQQDEIKGREDLEKIRGAYKSSSGKSSSGNSSSSEKIPQDVQKAYNNVMNKFNDGLAAIKADPYSDEAANADKALTDYAQEHKDNFDPAMASTMYAMAAMLAGFRFKMQGRDDDAAQKWQQVPSHLLKQYLGNDNSDLNFDNYPDW